ncbi:MAG: inositol monophosphatase family protein, partial [Halanaerobiales bacterium]
YDLCNVARGSLDGFWELKLSLWDVAAGKLIIEEAGGKVILIEDTDSVRIIAGNKVIVDVLLEELRAENDYWSIS